MSTATAEAEATVDIISELNKNKVPIWGTCRMHIGDGTTVVEWHDGRAKTTPDVAALLLGRTDMTVIDRTGQVAAVNAPEAVSEAEARQQLDLPARNPLPEMSQADQRREDARRVLAAEGGDVPSFPIPSGFATHTAEGERRCLATKSDGSQCANVTRDGWACGLGAHIQAVAQIAAEHPLSEGALAAQQAQARGSSED